MPLTRFKLSAIEDGGIATADLADGAVTTAKLADSAVTSVKTSNLFTNTEIAGTEAARMPVGTTAQRANEQSGDIRFNSTLSLMEYYDGTQWKSIDSPPTLSSADVSDFNASGDTITLTGSNFQSGMTVKLVGDDGTEYAAASVTLTNANSASFDITSAMATDNDPFDIVVTNPSGLSGTLSAALDFAPTPAFTIASGSLGDIYDSARSAASISSPTATSSDADDTITYAITSGALPSGMSFNTTTAAITGTPSAVGSDTTSTFTVTATATSAEDSGTVTNSRAYTITVRAPAISSFTSVGSGTFTVPTGTTAVDVLVVGGGGSGGMQSSTPDTHTGGGGGAGGLIYRPAFPVTPGGSISYTIGDGGAGDGQNNGQNSTFGTLTALGGGCGNDSTGQAGGSGGGTGSASGAGGGSAQQPSQPGDSGTYGFGYPGGTSYVGGGQYIGGGGGGAGDAGDTGSQNGQGGNGKQYDISGSQVYYAGGGGGAWRVAPGASTSWPAGGQGGGGNGATEGGPRIGQDGTDGLGAGGGGGHSYGGYGGAGGSGIVIVKY